MRLTRWSCALALAALAALAALPAQAADLALNAGVLEVVLLPGPAHGGLYPNVGVSVLVPFKGVTLIPSASVEWAPELGRGGLVLVFAVDYALGDRVGLDVQAALIHDQPGLQFAESAFYAGGGVGCSLFFGKLTLSPYLNLFATVGGSGLSLVPGLNVGWTL